ncbi:MAG: PrsW family intramembrane metalloprotease [Proteobacteria bacterium]|nr:PrsW family intramembrane metalloprotease [Pseudomonadota bacterium]
MIKVILMAAITSGIWLCILKCYAGKHSQPSSFLLWAGLMGGAFSVELSWILNTAFTDVTGIRFDNFTGSRSFQILILSYFVGFNEETWKLLATLLILKWSKKEVRHPLDIMILGITVSMGFEMWENIHYGHRYCWSLVLWRSLLPGHLLFGAMWSYGLKEMYVGRMSRVSVQIFVFSWILAAIVHATYDFLVSIDRAWGFYLGVLLIWLPLVFFHKQLRSLTGHKSRKRTPRDYSVGPVTEISPIPGLMSRSVAPKKPVCGVRSHQSDLAKSVHMSPETLTKLDDLRQRKHKKAGKLYSRNAYVQSMVAGLYNTMKKQGLGSGLYSFKNVSTPKDDFTLDSSQSVSLPYATLRMLDEIRQYAKNQSGRRISRDIYLTGVIDKLHVSLT